MDATGSEAATGATSLAEVLRAAETDGFRADFEVEVAAAAGEPDGLRCSVCGETSDAADVARLWTRRLEGASDPADMLHVSGLRCPRCSALGVLISPYGANIDPAHVEILQRLPPVRE